MKTEKHGIKSGGHLIKHGAVTNWLYLSLCNECIWKEQGLRSVAYLSCVSKVASGRVDDADEGGTVFKNVRPCVVNEHITTVYSFVCYNFTQLNTLPTGSSLLSTA